MPFRRWMEIAGGILGWSEAQFWDSSYQYFQASVDGWLELNGTKKPDLSEQEYEDFKQESAGFLSMTSDDLRRLREKKAQGE